MTSNFKHDGLYTGPYTGPGVKCGPADVRILNMCNFLWEVRSWNSPFLRLTDDRKQCFKRKKDLILRWRCNTKLVLTVTTLYREPRGKMGPWVGTRLKQH